VQNLVVRVLGLATLFALAACGRTDTAPTQGRRPDPGPVPVLVATATEQSLPVQLRAVGTVEASASVEVRARVGGEIRQVHFKEGSEVKKGDWLFSIDPRPLQVALDEARARLQRDQVLLAQAEAEAQRYGDLVKQEYVTRQQHDQAQANAAALRASVAVDEAAVASATLQLEYARITAPIGGRTGSVLVHAGNVTGPGDPRPLVVILQTRPVHVRFALPARHLADVRAAVAGQQPLAVQVLVGGQAGSTPIDGRLDFVDNAVNAGSGTVELKALFDNVDALLWPGQFVDVVLTLGAQDRALVVPTAAVQTGQQGDFVYVVGEDGTAAVQPVVVGRSAGELSAVEGGLRAGLTVVIDGQLRLLPGSRVAVRQPPGAASRPATAAVTPDASGSGIAAP
jgi:multidrug efflux system membrane fusion protein